MLLFHFRSNIINRFFRIKALTTSAGQRLDEKDHFLDDMNFERRDDKIFFIGFVSDFKSSKEN